MAKKSRPVFISKTETIDKDLGANRIIKGLNNLKGLSVKIGIQEDSGTYASGVSVPLVGFWMEFGTSRIPERSFIRSTINENKDKLESHRDRLLGMFLTGKISEVKALEQLGFMIQEMIKTTIKKKWEPALKPSTIRAKQYAGVRIPEKPLIWTGLLLNSISFQVER